MIFLKIFKKRKEIIHGISERKDGSVNPFSSRKAQKNILKAIKRAGFKNIGVGNLILPEQTHGSNVWFFSKPLKFLIKSRVDGLITNAEEMALVVKTADCVPVLFYSPSLKRIGAIHVGRKGLTKGILGNSLKFFKKDISFLKAGIGPHIRKCCYFLKGDGLKLKNNSRWKKYVEKRGGNFYFDLTKAVKDVLLKAGVKKENIEDCRICTFCQSQRFFSSRKNEAEPKIYEKEKIDGKLPCFASFILLR